MSNIHCSHCNSTLIDYNKEDNCIEIMCNECYKRDRYFYVGDNYSNNKSVFDEEINSIKDFTLRDFTNFALTQLPEYFWHVASSSSGQHHPVKSHGIGGLVRHTKAAIYIGQKLCDVYDMIDMKDRVTIALIFHDAIKYDIPKEQHTVKNHPELSAKFLIAVWYEYNKSKPNAEPRIDDIVSAISNHMGRWTPRSVGNELVFPTHFTKLDQIVHLADVISACKQVDILSIPNIVNTKI